MFLRCCKSPRLMKWWVSDASSMLCLRARSLSCATMAGWTWHILWDNLGSLSQVFIHDAYSVMPTSTNGVIQPLFCSSRPMFSRCSLSTSSHCSLYPLTVFSIFDTKCLSSIPEVNQHLSSTALGDMHDCLNTGEVFHVPSIACAPGFEKYEVAEGKQLHEVTIRSRRDPHDCPGWIRCLCNGTLLSWSALFLSRARGQQGGRLESSTMLNKCCRRGQSTNIRHCRASRTSSLSRCCAVSTTSPLTGENDA